jgi:hypothetical protein
MVRNNLSVQTSLKDIGGLAKAAVKFNRTSRHSEAFVGIWSGRIDKKTRYVRRLPKASS